MKLTVQVVLETDDDQDPAVVCDVFTLERALPALRDAAPADTVGLRLAEANDLLAAVQQPLVAEQARATVAARADPNRPARSARWPPPYRTASPRNWSTCRPSPAG